MLPVFYSAWQRRDSNCIALLNCAAFFFNEITMFKVSKTGKGFIKNSKGLIITWEIMNKKRNTTYSSLISMFYLIQ
jgi:hypothetical protein